MCNKPLLLCLISYACLQRATQNHRSLDELLKNRQYDKRTRPFNGGRPLNVTNQVFVLKLTSINEHDFTYEISYFIRQWWQDPRLASNKTTKVVTYHGDPSNLIWLPDLTLLNSDKNEKVEGNVATHIEHNGNVFTSLRKKATCSCIMDLSFYPMDTQQCPFILESYAYSINDVRLEWHSKPVDTEENLQLSGYYLVSILHEKVPKKYTVGNFSEIHDNLVLKFVVRRTFLYYLYRAYIPIMLLMVFNIGSYWIPDTALPARVTLIVTTFLTNVFILQSVSEQTVRVSSTTSLQVFIVVNITMIVIAIIEYLTVLHLKSRGKMKTFYPPNPDDPNGYNMNTLNSSTIQCYELTLPPEKPKSDVHKLDTIFRFVTPVVYLVFCCMYFGYYLGYLGFNV